VGPAVDCEEAAEEAFIALQFEEHKKMLEKSAPRYKWRGVASLAVGTILFVTQLLIRSLVKS